jgi:hypothetical protein
VPTYTVAGPCGCCGTPCECDKLEGIAAYEQYDVFASHGCPGGFGSGCDDAHWNATYRITYQGGCCWRNPAGPSSGWVFTNIGGTGSGANSILVTNSNSCNPVVSHVLGIAPPAWDWVSVFGPTNLSGGVCSCFAVPTPITITPVAGTQMSACSGGEGFAAPEPLMAAAAPAAGGPGTELEGMFAELGVTGTAGCGCKSVARQMDRWGPAGCRANAGVVVARLRENWAALRLAEKLGVALRAVTSGLAFVVDPRDPAPGLLAEAIRRAEAKSA